MKFMLLATKSFTFDKHFELLNIPFDMLAVKYYIMVYKFSKLWSLQDVATNQATENLTEEKAVQSDNSKSIE